MFAKEVASADVGYCSSCSFCGANSLDANRCSSEPFRRIPGGDKAGQPAQEMSGGDRSEKGPFSEQVKNCDSPKWMVLGRSAIEPDLRLFDPPTTWAAKSQQAEMAEGRQRKRGGLGDEAQDIRFQDRVAAGFGK